MALGFGACGVTIALAYGHPVWRADIAALAYAGVVLAGNYILR